MARVTISAEAIQGMIDSRVRRVQRLRANTALSICRPRLTCAEDGGCNWCIEILGVPDEDRVEMEAILRAVTRAVNLPDPGAEEAAEAVEESIADELEAQGVPEVWPFPPATGSAIHGSQARASL